MSDSLQKGITKFIDELKRAKIVPVVDRRDRYRVDAEFSVDYNVARIMILLKYAGVNGKLSSRVKFAFYDFLLRYPVCLKKLLDVESVEEEFSHAELSSIDKKMIKHLNTAWDTDYYNYVAYLQSRDLLSINLENAFSVELTATGKKVVDKLETEDTKDWIRR